MNTLLLSSRTDVVYLTDDDGNLITDDDGNLIIFSEDVYDWDLTVDSGGNLAVTTGAYAIAQDVASAVRLFLGELWYDTAQGIPYLEQIFGQRPPLQFLKAKFVGAGMTVPEVASIVCFLTGPGFDRQVGGELQITDNLGRVTVIESTTILQPGVSPWYVLSVSQEAAA